MNKFKIKNKITHYTLTAVLMVYTGESTLSLSEINLGGTHCYFRLNVYIL